MIFRSEFRRLWRGIRPPEDAKLIHPWSAGRSFGRTELRSTLAELGNFLAYGAAGDLAGAWALKRGLAAALRQFERGGEQVGEHGETDEAFIVVIDVIPQPGIALRIKAHHAIEVKRRAVRIDAGSAAPP
jgi:hypothetical protein